MFSRQHSEGNCRDFRSPGAIAISMLLGLLTFSFAMPNAVGEDLPSPAVDKALEALNLAYRLSERDLISISVFGEPDLETIQRIDGDGRVRLPLVGALPVAGLTIDEAVARMEAAYVEQRFLRDPEVTVMVREYASRGVSVLGQVASPGRVEFPLEVNAMALTEVISRAGGFTGIARSNAVRITRTVDGKETTEVVDADRLIRGNDGKEGTAQAEDVVVLPGDIIFVPESLF